VASLFAEFFRDLDIVPSDIIAGLVLLRQRQRSNRGAILDQVTGDGDQCGERKSEGWGDR
jgi:sn1-specific diacylglycerol lipase